MVVCRSSWANVVVSWDHRGDRDRDHFVAFSAGHVVSHAGVLGESCVHRAGDHASDAHGLGWQAESQGDPLGGFSAPQ